MTILKTALSTAFLLTATAGVANADGHTNPVTVISDAIITPELGPNLVMIAVVGGLLALLSATSASTTTN